MAGLADLLYLGQPDPSRQLAAMLAGRQQPGAPPPGPAPAGPGPAGPAGPAPAGPGPAAGPGDGSAPNPAPGAPPPPGSPPQPQALQSSPDMSQAYSQLANPPNIMSLYMQMQQRQSASDQINRGLALITANHSAPSMREAIMQSLTGGGQDAGSTVSNLMSLYQGQQQMGAQQQLLQQAPDIATKLGMPEGIVRAQILAGKGDELVKSMEPTDTMRNYQQARGMLQQAGVPADQIDTYTRPMLLGAGSNPAMSEYIQRIAEAQHTGTMAQHPELAGGFYSWQKSVEAQQAQTLDKQKQINDAQGQFGAINGVLTTMQGTTEDLQKKLAGGQLDKLFQLPQGVYKEAATNGVASALNSAVNWFGGKNIALSDDDKNNLKNILELSETPMQSLTATSPRHLAPQLGTIGTALAPISDLGRGKDGWGKKLDDLHDQILNTSADLYGGSGQTPPDNLKLRMNPIYAAGGSMNLRPAQPMSPADIQKDVAYVQQNPSKLADIVKGEKAGNYDTTELEKRLGQLQR
jgi:hypothetical protein